MFLKLAKKGPCRMYVARLEEAIRVLASAKALGNSPLPADPALAAHLRECAGCREALEAAELAGALLRESHLPQPDPGPMFASRVIAQIRLREKQLHWDFEFWNPMEVFARRLIWASSVLLLVLSSALYQMRASHGGPVPAQETITERFPELLPEQPANKDEVLVSLAEKAHE